MKNGSIICWCKWVVVTCLLFSFTSCDVSKFYFRKRIGLSVSENKTPCEAVNPVTQSDTALVSPLKKQENTIESTSVTDTSAISIQTKTDRVSYVQPIIQVQTHRVDGNFYYYAINKPGKYRAPRGFWGPFLMILLLLIILAVFGILLYLVGVFAFGLGWALILCILLFILLVTLLSALFTLILYLYGRLLMAIGHSYGKKMNPFK